MKEDKYVSKDSDLLKTGGYQPRKTHIKETPPIGGSKVKSNYKKRVLMLYDHEDIPEAQFDSVKAAASYLKKSSACLNSSMSRNQRLRSGHKLIWVNIGIDLGKEE